MLLTKVHLAKAMVFPVVMYGCESCTIKKAESWRIEAFKLCCWGRLLRFSWTARRSNQSIQRKSTLNIYWEDWCWSWSSSTLATWDKELTHWRRPWCWERLEAGGEGDGRGWGSWIAWARWTCVWANPGRQWRTGKGGMLWSMRLQSRTWLSDWTIKKSLFIIKELYSFFYS